MSELQLKHLEELLRQLEFAVIGYYEGRMDWFDRKKAHDAVVEYVSIESAKQ